MFKETLIEISRILYHRNGDDHGDLNKIQEAMKKLQKCYNCESHADIQDTYCRSCGVKLWSTVQRIRSQLK